jgi:two-component system cell cycle response regulator
MTAMKKVTHLKGNMQALPSEKGDETPSETLLKKIAALEKENERMKSLLLTDELTGLYNKRFFYLQLEIETARTRRTGQVCTLIAMDLDNFKAVNDTLGHHAGDQLLSEFAGVLAANIRPTDFACRFGGDEFFIIMPYCGLAESLAVSTRIQNSLKGANFRNYIAPGILVSVSVGLAFYEPFHEMGVEAFFQKADANLLLAKKSGKNTIYYDLDTRLLSTAVNNTERKALTMNIPTVNETEEK